MALLSTPMSTALLERSIRRQRIFHCNRPQIDCPTNAVGPWSTSTVSAALPNGSTPDQPLVQCPSQPYNDRSDKAVDIGSTAPIIRFAPCHVTRLHYCFDNDVDPGSTALLQECCRHRVDRSTKAVGAGLPSWQGDVCHVRRVARSMQSTSSQLSAARIWQSIPGIRPNDIAQARRWQHLAHARMPRDLRCCEGPCCG